MNAFREMGCSIAKVSAYPQFLKNRKGKVFGYGVLLLFLYFVIAYMIPAIVLQVRTGGIGAALEQYVPEFELSGGTLWVEEPCYLDDGTVYVDIDTDLYFDVQEAYGFAENYSSVIIMDAEKALFRNNGQSQVFYYTDLGNLSLNRDSLKSWIPMIYACIFVTGLFMYIGQVALFFFAVLFVALIGLIFSGILKANLTFGQLYLLGIYSRTLSLAVKALVKLVGIPIPFFWVLNFGLSLVYLFLAVNQVKKEQDRQMQSGGFDGYAQPCSVDPYGQSGYSQQESSSWDGSPREY